MILQKVLESYGIRVYDRPGNIVIKCPWGTHDDKKPSATADLTKGVFYCHTCGRGGDSISLIRERENVGYTEALRVEEGIAGRSGGELSSQLGDGRGGSRLSGGKRNHLSSGGRLSTGRSWR